MLSPGTYTPHHNNLFLYSMFSYKLIIYFQLCLHCSAAFPFNLSPHTSAAFSFALLKSCLHHNQYQEPCHLHSLYPMQAGFQISSRDNIHQPVFAAVFHKNSIAI